MYILPHPYEPVFKDFSALKVVSQKHLIIETRAVEALDIVPIFCLLQIYSKGIT